MQLVSTVRFYNTKVLRHTDGELSVIRQIAVVILLLETNLMYPEDYSTIYNKLLTNFKVYKSKRIRCDDSRVYKEKTTHHRTSWYHVKTGSIRERAFCTFFPVLAISMEKVLYFCVEMKAVSTSIPQLLWYLCSQEWLCNSKFVLLIWFYKAFVFFTNNFIVL